MVFIIKVIGIAGIIKDVETVGIIRVRDVDRTGTIGTTDTVTGTKDTVIIGTTGIMDTVTIGKVIGTIGVVMDTVTGITIDGITVPTTKVTTGTKDTDGDRTI